MLVCPLLGEHHNSGFEQKRVRTSTSVDTRRQREQNTRHGLTRHVAIVGGSRRVVDFGRGEEWLLVEHVAHDRQEDHARNRQPNTAPRTCTSTVIANDACSARCCYRDP